MVCQNFAIPEHVSCLAHPEAHRLSYEALRMAGPGVVVLDFSHVREVTTSAFARLVILRRELLRRGRDLRLTGLRDRAARLYEINRLESVLPSL